MVSCKFWPVCWLSYWRVSTLGVCAGRSETTPKLLKLRKSRTVLRVCRGCILDSCAAWTFPVSRCTPLVSASSSPAVGHSKQRHTKTGTAGSDSPEDVGDYAAAEATSQDAGFCIPAGSGRIEITPHVPGTHHSSFYVLPNWYSSPNIYGHTVR